jgi:hypothetical protein
MVQQVAQRSDGKIVQVATAGDVEVHASKADGRYYVIDTGRVLPPVPPRKAAVMEVSSLAVVRADREALASRTRRSTAPRL